jgi:hypothetical protein
MYNNPKIRFLREALSMWKKILGIVLIATSALVFAIEVPKGNTEPIGPAVLMIAVGIFFLAKKWKTSEEKLRKEKEKMQSVEMMRKLLSVEHLIGLPTAEGTRAALVFEDDHLEIKSSGSSFTLPYSRMLSANVKTDVEIQKAYTSSIGGAVGGAVLLGPIGAMIGGRTKEKKTKTIEYYLIITYDKEDKVEYMSFKLLNSEYQKAMSIIQRISSEFAEPKEIAL